MNKRWLLIAGIVLILTGSIGFLVRSKISGGKSGILIETNPPAQVFVNGENKGNTPYKETRAPGEVTLRLIPNANNGPLSTWESKVTLTAGIETVVRRDFGKTEMESAGEVLSFEKLAGSSSALTVVSSPDASQVSVDGQVKGFSPIRIEALLIGDHQIAVSQPGFTQRTIQARTEPGFRLTAVVKLAQAEQEATQEAEPEEPQTSLVEILQTPTGFLRVRAEPTTQATESARATPGKTYSFIEENEDKSWFKIEYEEGKEGWISAQYAKKVTQERR